MEKQAEMLNNEGVKLFLNKHFDEAEKKYKEALNIFPDYPSALNNMGMLFLQLKKWNQAEEYFLRAAQLKENETYYLNLGHVYTQRNELQKAEEFYLRSLELNPVSISALNSLSALFRSQYEFSKSANLWEQTYLNFIKDPQIIIEWAKDLLYQQKFIETLDLLNEIEESSDNQHLKWYYIALTYFKMKNFGYAESAINRALAFRPNEEIYRILAATINLALSNIDQAIENWDFILTVHPDNHQVRTDKAVVLLSIGYKKEALAELNIVLNKEPNYTKAKFYKALTLVEMDLRLSEAINILNELKSMETAYQEKASELWNSLQEDR